jgi:hypothetical protein
MAVVESAKSSPARLPTKTSAGNMKLGGRNMAKKKKAAKKAAKAPKKKAKKKK